MSFLSDSQLGRGLYSLSSSEKLARLKSLKVGLTNSKVQLADLLQLEVKKSQAEALAEVEKSLLAIEYVIQTAPLLNWGELLKLPEGYQMRLDPLGILLAIEPWNFPMWQLFRVLPWNFWIGNPVLHKNSRYTTQLAQALNQIIQESLGCEYFETLLLPDSEMGRLIEDPRVAAVTLTGSTRAGRQVASQCGRLLKKCVLELGGSDAFIVTEQAVVDEVLDQAILSRIQNNGQSCIAAKRFIIHSSVYARFLSQLVTRLKTFGPVTLIHPEALTQSLGQIDWAIQNGAKVIWPQGEGVLPAILEVTGQEEFLKELEFFAPVFVLSSFLTPSEAIELANHTDFGLGASVWGAKGGDVELYQVQLQAGFIAFDEMVKSNPQVPFGGIKASGFGREMGLLGFLEFANIKVIRIATDLSC